MKKLIPVLAALAILVSGCGEKSLEDRQAAFADTLGGEFPQQFGGAEPDSLWHYATAVCQALDKGVSFGLTTATIQESAGYSPYEAGFIVGAAIATACPEHEDLIDHLSVT